MKQIIHVSIGMALLLQACSHPIEIVGEGDVWATDGRTCRMEGDEAGQTNCSKNYVVSTYHTTYFAEPRIHWKFDHWGNYCDHATDNSCSFNLSTQVVRKFWGVTLPPLQAVFTPLDSDGDAILDEIDPCPLNPSSPCSVISTEDSIVVNGKEWAQPDLFTGISWLDIDALCPSGRCGSVGTLNGKDLGGWTWASVDTLNGLFNVYVSPASIGPGPSRYEAVNSKGAPVAFAPPQGFRATDTNANVVQVKGLTSSTTDIDSNSAHSGFILDDFSALELDVFATDESVLKPSAGAATGAWLWAPVPSVTLANLNVLHGFDCDSPEIDTQQCRVSERIALLRDHVVAAGCPDVVTLQEVINREFAPNGQPVQSILSLIEAEAPNLATACGFTYQIVYKPLLTVGISELDEEVILSRYPVLRIGTRNLYGLLFDQTTGTGVFARHVLYARIDHPNGKLEVYTTHLASGSDFANSECVAGACPAQCTSGDTVRACQAEQLALYVEQTRGNDNLALITGDFNARPGSTEYLAMTSRGWLDSHLDVGQAECDSITGIGCSSGRSSSLTQIESPALNVDERIDYIFIALPAENTVCSHSRGGLPQQTPGRWVIDTAGLFAHKPNPFAATCGSMPSPLCWVSDHSGNQARLVCGPKTHKDRI